MRNLRQTFSWAVAMVLAGAGFAIPAGAVDPDEARLQERSIERALVERLGPDAATIRVVSLGHRVILAGEVEQRVTAELSGEVALSLDGVSDVSNRVKARRDLELVDGKLLLEGEDAQLEFEVKRALWRDVGETTARALEVEAVDGVVSLRGTALDDSHREQALASAAHVPGVRSVLDLLRVRV